MRLITRMATTAAIALALAMPATVSAVASAAPAPTETATTLAATCHYRVTVNGAPVRNNPSNSARIIKRKYKNDPVTGPCQAVYREGTWWTRVYLGNGGTAWMKSVHLARR